jgi:hypothetical protein
MNAKANRRSLQPNPAPRSRPGDGTPINVVLEQFTATDGTQVTNIGIDLNQAPVPDRRFAADSCGVIVKNGTVKILFGQDRVSGDGWRSLVIVQMSARAAGRFLGSLAHPNNPFLELKKTTAELYGVEKLVESFSEPPQGQAIALAANLPAIGITDNETCLDFYQTSPFALSAVANTEELALEPVVRVDLRSSLFLGLLEGLVANGIDPMEFKEKGVSNG